MRSRYALPVFLLATMLPAQVVKTVLGNGPSQNRYDLVILGDGYTAAQQDRFDRNVSSLTTALFDTEPYKTFARYFNVHSVFRASPESGADHPDAQPPLFKDTAYGAFYISGTVCLFIENTDLALQDASLAPELEGPVMLLVNDASRYGGCTAGTISVSYNGPGMADIMIHELGHTFGGLADEYVSFNELYSGPEPQEKNITKSATGDKWSQWHGYDGIGAFQGAGYYTRGLFRPREDCLMRTLGTPNCAVCSEQLILKTYEAVTPIEQPIPGEDSVVLDVGAFQEFSFLNLVPPSGNSTVFWRVDGAVQPFGTTNYFLNTASVGPGDHRVEVEVTDHTPMVRLDPTGLLVNRHEWMVTVLDPGLPDLAVQSVQGGFAVSGQTMTISTVVRNDGFTGDSGTFMLEHFLSADPKLEEQDIYLGSYEVSNLTPGESRTVVRPGVRIPIQAKPGVWFLWARLDRSDDVVENSEINNSGFHYAFVSGPGCGPHLEYRDPLLYPHDSASLNAISGGTVMPTVIAPCASPGTSYLVVLGCSGTAPGTTVAPGITVPLNADACTTLVLSSLNTQALVGFYGELDESGVGNATFNLPPGLPITQIMGHFAALLIDGSGNFSATSNAVKILIGF